jgi:uncharacterized protein
MLLLIALSHAPVFLYAIDLTTMSPLDEAVMRVRYVLVEHRAFPMFAFLFGYGLVQMLGRRQQRGEDWRATRRLLRRRGLWLVVLGFLHAALLFRADILAVYGVTVLLFVGMLRAGDRTLLWVAALFLLPAAGIGWNRGSPDWAAAADGYVTAVFASTAQADPLLAAVQRLQEWAPAPVAAQSVTVTAVMLGVWAARRRFLEDPARHRSLLTWAAIFGLGVSALGGLPLALSFPEYWTGAAGTLSASSAAMTHTLTGYAGGIGAAALIALLALRFSGSPGRITTAIAAIGQRSLSCYLLQSVVFMLVCAPYALGLGGRLGFAAAAGVAVAIWLVSVLLADLLRHIGPRGPAEALLRRLTYG